jgi:uncharacterized protein DUF2721
MTPIDSLVHFLQSSITPMVLISGVGLLLLSLTSRLGRTIDRSRIIANELQHRDVRHREMKVQQLSILYRRSKLLRSSIVAISFSILSSSLIIPVLLIMNLWAVDLKIPGVVLFLLSVAGIILSAIFLLIDVTLTLKALHYEVKDHLS